MKRILTHIFLFVSVATLFAQTTTKVDLRSVGQNTITYINNSAQSSLDKDDNDNSQLISGTESVTYSTNSEGILITINSGSNKIKLFALTGQLLFKGELSQGRLLIQTRKGIYFLKVNNKSFKVVCR